MRLLIAGIMMKKADVVLLDEPTNHLDVEAVKWLSDYLNSLQDSAIMVISHDPFFLNRICTDIINYNEAKLNYYEGNFDAFKKKLGLKDDEASALLAGQVDVNDRGVVDYGTGGSTIEGGLNNRGSGASAAGDLASQTSATQEVVGGNDVAVVEHDEPPPADNGSKESAGGGAGEGGEKAAEKESDRKAKIVFPIPGKVKGLTSMMKPVLEVGRGPGSWARSR